MERSILGTFDGQNMVSDDGRHYPVLANYASKSRLVEGDRMRLTITKDGDFIFKQIMPAPRRKTIGIYVGNDTVDVDGQLYSVLHSSVTYYSLIDGDQVTVYVPKETKRMWAAVDNVIPGIRQDKDIELPPLKTKEDLDYTKSGMWED